MRFLLPWSRRRAAQCRIETKCHKYWLDECDRWCHTHKVQWDTGGPCPNQAQERNP